MVIIFFSIDQQMIQQQQTNERKLSIIRETSDKNDQVKGFMEEIDKLNQTLSKERSEKDNKVLISCFWFWMFEFFDFFEF